MIVLTASGEIKNEDMKLLAHDESEFIEKYLQKYSSHPDVTLSNDICVVIDVLNSYKDCYKYMKLPEYERDYSNAPFKNVMQYIDDLNDMHKLETLLSEVDRDLFIEAVEDYKRMNNL